MTVTDNELRWSSCWAGRRDGDTTSSSDQWTGRYKDGQELAGRRRACWIACSDTRAERSGGRRATIDWHYDVKVTSGERWRVGLRLCGRMSNKAGRQHTIRIIRQRRWRAIINMLEYLPKCRCLALWYTVRRLITAASTWATAVAAAACHGALSLRMFDDESNQIRPRRSTDKKRKTTKHLKTRSQAVARIADRIYYLAEDSNYTDCC